MNRAVFVPLTDEMIADNPDLLNEILVPYSPGMPCHHGLAEEQEEPRSDDAGGTAGAR
jgi:hypothetical protein